MEILTDPAIYNVLPFVFLVAFLTGVVKGVVGFGMPMLLISGTSIFLPPDLALAALLMPTVFSNIFQAFEQGLDAARASVIKFTEFLVIAAVFLILGAQLVVHIPGPLFLGVLGCIVVGFSVLLMSGYQIELGQSQVVPRLLAITAGFVGGLSGVYGPPTVAYLTALKTEKTEQIRVQGIVFGLGTVLLVAAHVVSGILNAQTIWLSLSLVPFAMFGTYLGGGLRNRFDQNQFRRATLIVLFLAGLNLIRLAVFG